MKQYTLDEIRQMSLEDIEKDEDLTIDITVKRKRTYQKPRNGSPLRGHVDHVVMVNTTEKNKIYGKYNRPNKKLFMEVNSGELIVETAGYVPPHIRIQELLDAGERLIAYRKEQYNFGRGEQIDETFTDPTRDPNFDMVDADNLIRETDAKIKESQRKAVLEQKRKAEESRKEKEDLERSQRKENTPENGGK